MKTTIRQKLTGVLLIAGVLLAACAGGGAAPTQPSAPTGGEGPVRGGTVVLIIPEEPAGLNRYLADAAIVRQVSDATVIGLVTPNEKGEFVPRLAAELPTVSEDKLTVTWKLRPGLKWSDGRPLTSDDIKFTWEVISNPNSGAFNETQGFNLITAIETPDATTAIVKYSEPFVGYLGQFAAGIFPRHATGTPETMTTWEWNMKPVAAGPFVVTDWQSGQSITLERNPHYYEPGKPYLDRLIFRIIPEPAAQTAVMKQGEAHVQLWPGEDKADWDALMGGIATQQLVPGIWNMAIDFNLSRPGDNDPSAANPHPILGDLRVRQAIAHAIDYDTLVRDVMRGQVQPSTNPFAYGWYKCDLPRLHGYDPEKAKQLLTEAGWVEGTDGIRVAKGARYAPDGTRLSLELQGYTNFEPLERTQQFIVEKLKQVGIEARVQNYDFSIIFGSYADGSPRKVGDFDMLIYDRGFGLEPHGEVADIWLSTNIPSQTNVDGGNIFRWVNPQADEAIAAAGATFDQAARRQAYCRLGELIQQDLPQLYLYLFQDGYGFNNKVQGYTVSTWGSMTWDVENWWLR
ncbi:MAG: peptide ABC transporter substrate-binding protein [Anaerolineales bacterium]|nr:peptide ABC transporter substrate-binding protein [Anaerolineales bacterium]